MSKLHPIQVDDQTTIWVAAPSRSDLDISALQRVSASSSAPTPVTPAEDDEMQLPDPNAPSVNLGNEEQTAEVQGPQEKNLKEDYQRVVQKAKDTLTSGISKSPATVGELVKSYSSYLLRNLKEVATTEVGVSKVILEFGVELEMETGIPYIASSGVTSSVKVVLECDLTASPSPEASD